VKRSSLLLFLTIPACVAIGRYAMREMRAMQAISSESVVTTFRAAPTQTLELPAAGTYWVVAIGEPRAMTAARAWTPELVHEETGLPATVDAGDPRRTGKRKDRGGLDLLFIMRAASPGRHALRLASDGASLPEIHLRVTRFTRASASIAMRSMGAAVLFSVLLLISAILWFRRR
jgi:hypothetical protein